jgi:MHS family proline/betaine transporter-like MFS transporter
MMVEAALRDSASSSDSITLRTRVRSVVTAAIGNVLEWYDFIIFAYFAQTIGAAFFPAADPVASLLSTLAVFGIGFVMRPIGAIVIGRFADKYGRKPALLLTIWLMGGATVAIGLAPSYESIGILAPIILTLARLVQGFSAGGEWGSATAFLIEWAPRHRRGFYGSFGQGTIILGVLAGSGTAAAFSTFLSAEDLQSWGWRVPFILGGLIGLVGLYMRSNVEETPTFREKQDPPFVPTSRKWSMAWMVFAISAMPHALFYVGFAYLPTFAQTQLSIGRAEALWSNTIGLALIVLSVPFTGLLTDRIGRKPVLVTTALCVAILPYPLISWLLASPEISTFFTVQAVLAIVYALILSTVPATFVEMVPTHIRLFIMSTAYNAAGVVFGAFAPFFAVWIVQQTGMPVSVSILLIAAGVTACAGLIGFRETVGRQLD